MRRLAEINSDVWHWVRPLSLSCRIGRANRHDRRAYWPQANSEGNRRRLRGEIFYLRLLHNLDSCNRFGMTGKVAPDFDAVLAADL